MPKPGRFGTIRADERLCLSDRLECLSWICIGVRQMKRRVLIVDDVEDIRLMLRYMIEKEGHVIVAEAANGLEAVEKYREHRPDVTIMDIDMPFKNGVEAAREIRELGGSSNIVFCSGGFSKHETPPAELRAEGSSFLRKPFLPAQLYQALVAF